MLIWMLIKQTFGYCNTFGLANIYKQVSIVLKCLYHITNAFLR